jgi:glycosyltransferase involved in cell wall biosynthesis
MAGRREPVTTPLKVLRVIARLNVGGPARHVVILDDGLRRMGFQTILAYGETGPHEASLEGLVEARGIPGRRIPGLGRRISLAGDLRAFATLVRLVFALEPDIVHTHTAKAGTLGRLAAWLYNLTRARRRALVVHTFHGHVLHGYFGVVVSRLVRVVERWLGRRTDAILVLSARQRHDIEERYGIGRAGQVHVVPLGLELAPLLGLPVRAVANPDRVVFGFVGRFVPIKNLPLLVDAFARVRRHLPEARLLLVGDGEVRPAIEERMAALGIEAAVELAGWQAALEVVYSRMDVLVLTSANEGTPVAVIEAMAAGLPVVATAVGGVPDVIDHGVTGVLVRAGAADELADEMLRLGRSHGERHRLGAAAREAVRTRFVAERLVSDVAALYRTELDRARAPRRAG